MKSVAAKDEVRSRWANNLRGDFNPGVGGKRWGADLVEGHVWMFFCGGGRRSIGREEVWKGSQEEALGF